MRLFEPGTIELYSADQEWVQGTGSDLGDKRNHPIFYVQSFIECVFPEVGAKTWKWHTPIHTALAQTDLDPRLVGDVTSGTGDSRKLHYLLPFFTQALLILSGAGDSVDIEVNLTALVCLIGAFHNPKGTHLPAARSEFQRTLQSRFRTPITNAYVEAFAGLQVTTKADPQVIVRNRILAKKHIREGLFKSRSAAMSLLSHHKALSAIIETLFHKMLRSVAEMRYRQFDSMLEKSHFPWDPSHEDGTAVGHQLQWWQLRGALTCYDRIQAMSDECLKCQKDYEEAIWDIFFSLG